MSGFKKLEGDTAVLSQAGVFRSCDLYEWQGDVYASLGGGYVRLRANGTTSKDKVRLEFLETDASLFQDKFGRLSFRDAEGYKPGEVSGAGTLLLEDRSKQ